MTRTRVSTDALFLVAVPNREPAKRSAAGRWARSVRAVSHSSEAQTYHGKMKFTGTALSGSSRPQEAPQLFVHR